MTFDKLWYSVSPGTKISNGEATITTGQYISIDILRVLHIAGLCALESEWHVVERRKENRMSVLSVGDTVRFRVEEA